MNQFLDFLNKINKLETIKSDKKTILIQKCKDKFNLKIIRSLKIK